MAYFRFGSICVLKWLQKKGVIMEDSNTLVFLLHLRTIYTKLHQQTNWKFLEQKKNVCTSCTN